DTGMEIGDEAGTTGDTTTDTTTTSDTSDTDTTSDTTTTDTTTDTTTTDTTDTDTTGGPVCGNGVIDMGEECDGNNLGNKKCRSGHDQVTCNPQTCTFDFSECPPCGDGTWDRETEECDWNYEPTAQFGEFVQCTELEPLGEIDYKDYTSGQILVTVCSESCLLSRKPCGFCGDGELDGAYIDIGPGDAPVSQGAEVCDGPFVDPEALSKLCRNVCKENPEDAGSTLNLRCAYTCAQGCKELEPPTIESNPIEDAGCCVIGGQSCDPVLPCCFALDHPGEEGCKTVAIETEEGTIFVDRCRSF
ncbi:MAG: hypothetical protein KC457_31655, partial [Myxococcales bacterium]|nr:hypothetical protein [Myxococcales bacterium]